MATSPEPSPRRLNSAQGARALQEDPVRGLGATDAGDDPELQLIKTEIESILGFITAVAYRDLDQFARKFGGEFGLIDPASSRSEIRPMAADEFHAK